MRNEQPMDDIRVVTIHRDTWAGDTRIVSRPKYRYTYRDTTSGASSYVSACIAIQGPETINVF